MVLGDIVSIKLGNIVPADACLSEGDPLEIDQSALTGESLPVTKHPRNEVFSSKEKLRLWLSLLVSMPVFRNKEGGIMLLRGNRNVTVVDRKVHISALLLLHSFPWISLL